MELIPFSYPPQIHPFSTWKDVVQPLPCFDLATTAELTQSNLSLGFYENSYRLESLLHSSGGQLSAAKRVSAVTALCRCPCSQIHLASNDFLVRDATCLKLWQSGPQWMCCYNAATWIGDSADKHKPCYWIRQHCKLWTHSITHMGLGGDLKHTVKNALVSCQELEAGTPGLHCFTIRLNRLLQRYVG